ncbi:MAG: hypothetical protein AAF355_16135 [Myxococcota bacterium]
MIQKFLALMKQIEHIPMHHVICFHGELCPDSLCLVLDPGTVFALDSTIPLQHLPVEDVLDLLTEHRSRAGMMEVSDVVYELQRKLAF